MGYLEGRLHALVFVEHPTGIMKARSNHEPDADNPEWTANDFASAQPFIGLPESLRAKLPPRGLQKAPVKERITMRLSKDVVAKFRASGPGWQTRIDAALKEWLETHHQA
uniref:BrnA antitoxin of type II toxin-antitoxin system n=1 Tax=mine drainage metagenome TaxID=410659 RepID=E6QJI8_9ZZZZ